MGTENDNKRYPCNGNVLYVRGDTIYQEAIKGGLGVLFKGKFPSNGYLCTNSQFGYDPVPGKKKQCFCDQDNKYKWNGVK